MNKSESDNYRVFRNEFTKHLPTPNPKYTSFLEVDVSGNDLYKCYEKARKIVDSVVAIIKLYSLQSPLLEISPTYLQKSTSSKFPDGWFICYDDHSVLHWDAKLDFSKLKEKMDYFTNYLSTIEKNELASSIYYSLMRFSVSSTLANPLMRLSEKVGCIETLLTIRPSQKQTESIPNQLIRRMESILGNQLTSCQKNQFKTYYDLRSEYFHSSKTENEKLEEYDACISLLFNQILIKIVDFIDKYDSMRDFIIELDKKNPP